ncbi:MAG TPA: hypothetical protein VJ103_00720 [Candidatus Paceibacterota bacterium]|nr:hypothetical protein [Candidatus Paceibacterota bacterium]
MVKTASLRWRVLKSLAFFKKSGQIVSLKRNPFSIPTENFISLIIKLKNGLEITINVDRSNRDHFACEISKSRARKFNLLVKDYCTSKTLEHIIEMELKKRKNGALNEKGFLKETRKAMIFRLTPIKRIYKSSDTEDKAGLDYWLVYKKKLLVPINVKSSKHFQERHSETRSRIPSIVFFRGDRELLKKLEIICSNYKKGIISHL